jgi:hypothetical protein
VDPVVVPVGRIDLEIGAEREIVADPDEDLEGRCETDPVGLPVDVFDVAVVRVIVGL